MAAPDQAASSQPGRQGDRRTRSSGRHQTTQTELHNGERCDTLFSVSLSLSHTQKTELYMGTCAQAYTPLSQAPPLRPGRALETHMSTQTQCPWHIYTAASRSLLPYPFQVLLNSSPGKVQLMRAKALLHVGPAEHSEVTGSLTLGHSPMRWVFLPPPTDEGMDSERSRHLLKPHSW